jgi:hypothetical protein
MPPFNEDFSVSNYTLYSVPGKKKKKVTHNFTVKPKATIKMGEKVANTRNMAKHTDHVAQGV